MITGFIYLSLVYN